MKGLFIVGNSRSGTTLMSRVLGRHSDIYQLNELHFYEELYEPQINAPRISESDSNNLFNTLMARDIYGYLEYKSKDPLFSHLEFPLPANTNKAIDVFKHMLTTRTLNAEKKLFCEQTPRNAFYIEDIITSFPDSHIVFMMRDPRAVLLSQKLKWKRRYLGASNIPLRESIRSWANFHPYLISKMWNSIAKIAIQYENHPNVTLVKFEEFTQNPQATLVDLCRKLNIPFEENMLQVEVKGSSTRADQNKKGVVAKTSTENSFQGITAAEQFICERINADLIQRFNYVNIQSKALPYFGLVINFFLLFFKSGLSLVLNLNRFKNLRKTIKKRFGV
jgi:hypothetical protein